jgi:protein transport protein SEC24
MFGLCFFLLTLVQLSAKLSTLNDYPASMYNLPLSTLALLKNIAFKDGADVPIETRSVVQLDLNSMGLTELDLFVQPKIFRIDEFKGNEGLYDASGFVTLPEELYLTASSLTSDSAILLNNGRSFYLRLGRGVNSGFLQELFGIQSLEAVHLESLQLRYPENFEGVTRLHRVWNLLNYFRSTSSVYQDLRIFREGDPSELRFFDMLIHDRTMSVMALDEFVTYLAGHT